MSGLLLKILEMSLYGTIAIAVVFIFRLIFRKFPKRITLLFWAIVAIRLLCPYNFSSPISLMNIGGAEELRNKVIQTEERGTGIPEIKISEATYKGPYEEKGVGFFDIAPYVWAGGVTVMLTYAVVDYIKTSRVVKRCRKSDKGDFYESDEIDSPFASGILRPRICLPTDIKDDERDHILRHERMHVMNHDSILKLIGYLVVAIHWFNPFVWLSFFKLCSDIEMRCDEEVIEDMNLERKKAYCRSIVTHAVKDEPMPQVQNASFSGVGFGGMEAKFRVKNLLQYRRTSRKAAALILLISISLTALASACSIKTEQLVEQTIETTKIPSVVSSLLDEDRDDILNEYVKSYMEQGMKIARIDTLSDGGDGDGTRVVLVNDEHTVRKTIINTSKLTTLFDEFGNGTELRGSGLSIKENDDMTWYYDGYYVTSKHTKDQFDKAACSGRLLEDKDSDYAIDWYYGSQVMITRECHTEDHVVVETDYAIKS